MTAGETDPVPRLDLLDGVAPDELAARLRSEAARLTGAPAGVYIVEVEGHVLIRVGDADGFPDRFEIPDTIGMELTREVEPELRDRIAEVIPGPVAVQPLWVGPRAQVVLIARSGDERALAPLVREGGAAVDLANRCTDVFHRARRVRRAQAAAELQKDLMPPSVGVVAGGELATAILPAYEVGGDFCDWAQNPEGTRMSVADGVGKGGRAMAMCAVALGALRSARRCGDGLADTARAMDGELRALERPADYVTAVLADWTPGTRTMRWLRLGHPSPLLIDRDGVLHELADDRGYLPLGLFATEGAELQCSTRTLAPGERFVLYSDGVTERRGEDGRRFSLDGVQAAVAGLQEDSAAATVRAILLAVRELAGDPPSDDATLIAFRAR